MKIPCDVAADLLPLYHDGVCSQSTKKLIEEHLKECEACRIMLGKISNTTIDNKIKAERQGVVMHQAKALKRKSVFWGISIAVGVITLMMMIDLIASGDEWFSAFLLPLMYAVPVSIYQFNKHAKAKNVNVFTRVGLCALVGAPAFHIAITLFELILSGVFNFRLAATNLAVWDNAITVNANIEAIILGVCVIVGGILFAIGKQKQQSRFN